MNYLSNDEQERYWFQYKAEYEPHGISLEQFCNTMKISYRAMDNWSRQIRSKVVPVEVEGMPDGNATTKDKGIKPDGRASESRYVSCKHRQAYPTSGKKTIQDDSIKSDMTPDAVRIMINIKATNGLSVFQKNLSYEGLRLLVERLEGIC